MWEKAVWFHGFDLLSLSLSFFFKVVDRANNVRYGLCASVWAGDVGVVHRVSSR